MKDEEVAAVMGQTGGWHVSPSVQPLEPSPVVTVVSTEPPPPPLSQTRARREQKSTKKVLTLADFPPGECEVLTPRVGVGVAPTWLPVVGRKVTDGCLIVKNEEGGQERLTINLVNELCNQHGEAGVKRSLFTAPDVSERRVVPRTEEPAAPAAPAAPGPSAEDGVTILLDEEPVESAAEREAAKMEMVKVKTEQENGARRGERSHVASEQEELRNRLLREPDGVTPRKVFRRGDCRVGGQPAYSIQTVLGGSPMEPFPIATEDVPPFLRQGDCFVAGSSGWCPFAPSFAGDKGVIEMCVEERISLNQNTFHFFRQLPPSRHKFPRSAYHGPHATNGFLYLGTYTIPDRDELMFVRFVEHPFEWQYTYVSFMIERGRMVADDKFYSDTQVTPYDVVDTTREEYGGTREVKKVHDDMGADEDGKQMTLKEYLELHECALLDSDAKAALLRQLRTENLQQPYCYVEPVGYDEALYQALVDAGAQGVSKGAPKHVSLDRNELGYL